MIPVTFETLSSSLIVWKITTDLFGPHSISSRTDSAFKLHQVHVDDEDSFTVSGDHLRHKTNKL